MRNNRQHKKLKSGIYTQWCYQMKLSQYLTETEEEFLCDLAGVHNVFLSTVDGQHLFFHTHNLLSDVITFEKNSLKKFLNAIEIHVVYVKVTDSEGLRIIREEGEL